MPRRMDSSDRVIRADRPPEAILEFPTEEERSSVPEKTFELKMRLRLWT